MEGKVGVAVHKARVRSQLGVSEAENMAQVGSVKGTKVRWCWGALKGLQK